MQNPEKLEQLRDELGQAKKAVREIEGQIGTLSLSPDDPQSIEAAIRHADALVDERLGAAPRNPIVAAMARAMKEKARHAIQGRAASLRQNAARS